MRLILLGPPGSGKGTQAKFLCEQRRMRHISTGDILREAIAKRTALGQKAEPYINNGQLVPDALVNEMVAELFRAADRPTSFLLDGYPRTIAQAEALDHLLKTLALPLDHVLKLQVDDEEIVRRISGRRVAPSSGMVYHDLYNPPRVAGRCDQTGEALIQRPDDREETVRERLRVYRSATVPLLDYYRRNGLLAEVMGTGSVDEVAASIDRVLSGE